MKIIKLLLVPSMILWLASCGGGGESGGGNTTNGSSNNYNITADVDTVDLTFLQGNSTEEVLISVEFDGDGVIAGYPPGQQEPYWMNMYEVSTRGKTTTFNLIFMTNLNAGSYSTKVRFLTGSIDSGESTYIDVPVSLLVDEPFTVNRKLLNEFHVTEGNEQFAYPTEGLNLGVKGRLSEWSISVDSNWIIADNLSGVGEGTVNLNVDVAGLSFGEHTATVSIYEAVTGETEDVTVSLFYHEQLSSTALNGNSSTQFDFSVSEFHVDTTQGVVYISDQAEKKIYLVDIATGLPQSVLDVDFMPGRFAQGPDGNKLYVVMLRQEYAGILDEELEKGYVGVIDLSQQKIVDYFPTNIDPFDISITNNNQLVVTGGSNQHTEIHAYDLDTAECINCSGAASISWKSYLTMHPNNEWIFTFKNESLERFNIINGYISSTLRTPYHEGTRSGSDVWLTPNGESVITAGGDVFSATDLTYKTSFLVEEFSQFYDYLAYGLPELTSLVFDETEDRVIYSASFGVIESYNLTDFSHIETIAEADEFKLREVFMFDDKLYSITYKIDEQVYGTGYFYLESL